MSYMDEVVTFLQADTTLTTLLSGGIWKYSDAGRKGTNRLQLPGAYDEQNGLIKPVAVVAENDFEMDEQVIGISAGRFSGVAPIYIRIMDHGDRGYGTIQQASDRVRAILNCKPQIIASAWQLIWKKTIKDRREPNMRDAAYYQELYHVFGWTG